MNYRNPQLRSKLAAEYVLGTLHGAARKRFQSLLRYDAGLRALVAQWETWLMPLALTAGEMTPPARVWHGIEARINPASARNRWWHSLALWRGLAVAGAIAAITFGVLLQTAPAPEPPVAVVAVMNNEQSRPAMVVSWPPQKSLREPHLRVRIIDEHATMAANTAWQLWMLPGGNRAPVSLGLITTAAVQTVKLPRALANNMGAAWGMALSVEPAGGSPTGAPTGPVIYKGQCVRML